MIHLPIYSLPKSFIAPLLRGMIALAKQIGALRANINRKRGKLIMRGLTYEQSWLVDCFTAIGFRRVEFRTFQVQSNQDGHDFILAEKPANKTVPPTSLRGVAPP